MTPAGGRHQPQAATVQSAPATATSANPPTRQIP
jgi:hypothetical protein